MKTIYLMAVEAPFLVDGFKKGNNIPVPVYKEVDIQTQETLVQVPLEAGKNFPLIALNKDEFVIVTLNDKGQVEVKVRELIPDKDTTGRFQPHYTSSLWDPFTEARQQKEPTGNHVWTRISPLPFNITYDPVSQMLSFQEGKIEKTLYWMVPPG